MGTPAAICVDDDFAPSDASVTLRPANDEKSGRLNLNGLVIVKAYSAWWYVHGRRSSHPDIGLE